MDRERDGGGAALGGCVPVDRDRAEISAVKPLAYPVAVGLVVVVDPLGLVEAAGGEVIERIRNRIVAGRDPADLGGVAVAANHDHPRRSRLTDRPQEPSPLGREITPVLPAMLDARQLNAREHDPQVGRLLERLGEPRPLGVSEHRGLGIVAGNIGAPALHPLGLRQRSQRRAMEPRIETDELHPPAGRADDQLPEDAFPLSHGRVGRNPEEIEKHLLRLRPHRILAAAVVNAVVVIVPHRHDRHRVANGAEASVGGEQVILPPQHGHVLGVAVDVVTEHEQQLGAIGRDSRPNRHRPVLLGTGAHRDPGNEKIGGWLSCRDGMRQRRHDMQGEEHHGGRDGVLHGGVSRSR